MLCDAEAKAVVQILVILAQPLVEFQSACSAKLRKMSDNLAWQVDMCNGGILHTLQAMLRLTIDNERLESMGFPTCVTADLTGEEDPGVITLDEYASLAMRFTFRCFSRRLERCSHILYGWPYRCCLFTHPAHRDSALQEFRMRFHHYQKLCAFTSRTAREMQTRSVFLLAAVVQVVRILDLQPPPMLLTDRAVDFFRCRHLSICNTNL